MNIFELEAISIRSYLQRHGYEATILADCVLVNDPVWSYNTGVYARDEKDKIVQIRGIAQAVRFVTDRE